MVFAAADRKKTPPQSAKLTAPPVGEPRTGEGPLPWKSEVVPDRSAWGRHGGRPLHGAVSNLAQG